LGENLDNHMLIKDTKTIRDLIYYQYAKIISEQIKKSRKGKHEHIWHLFKHNKQNQDELFEQSDKEKTVVFGLKEGGPIIEFINATIEGDNGKALAAACKTLRCPFCSAEYRLAEALKSVPEKGKDSGWRQVQCPKCGERIIVFGRKSQ